MASIDTAPHRTTPLRVQVVRFDIPFLQLVWLLIKVAIAAIPAAIVFAVFMAAITAAAGFLFTGLFTGIFNPSRWI